MREKYYDECGTIAEAVLRATKLLILPLRYYVGFTDKELCERVFEDEEKEVCQPGNNESNIEERENRREKGHSRQTSICPNFSILYSNARESTFV